MATYYFEGYPIVAPFTIESIKVILSSETISGKIFRRASEGQRWELSFKVITDDPQDLFITMLENEIETKSMTMPQLVTVDNKLSPIVGFPTVVTTATAGNNNVTIDTTGLASYDTDKVIPKGSFVQFANHDKVYTVISEVSEGTTVSINVYPSLQADVSSSTQIYLPNTETKPSFKYVRSLDRIAGMTYNDGILVDTGTLTLQEKV